jgi:hypothetical protein
MKQQLALSHKTLFDMFELFHGRTLMDQRILCLGEILLRNHSDAINDLVLVSTSQITVNNQLRESLTYQFLEEF